ncbi:MAG: radical SAM protein [Rariglobus sp.]|nr:radical SAM protein [Rariglobus sp.]
MRSTAYPAFGLTLVVNHACNLRCSYCYTGAKFHAAMPVAVGERAIRRALASVSAGGVLQIGFFGGEPLIEARSIHDWMQIARRESRVQGKQVRFNLTTNGTVVDAAAWSVVMDPEVDVAVSCDGTVGQHDKHRRDIHGHGSFARVENTLRELVATGRAFSVVMVVRPDTLEELPDGLRHLRGLGITQFTLSLDVWTRWEAADLENLARVVDVAADLWRTWLPDASIDWFDTRIAAVAGLPSARIDTRCGFGEGEIAVAPSGRLYPCERLVGDDRSGHPLQLPGLVDEGDDFLGVSAPCSGPGDACATGASCRCSNYIRSGSTAVEDGLLRALDDAVHHSLERLIVASQPFDKGSPHE